MAGYRSAHAPGSRNAESSAGGYHQIAFGLTVELVDGDAERRLAPFVDLRAECLAARADRAQLQVCLWQWRRAQHAQRCRRDERVAHTHLGHQREGRFGVELPE